MYTFLIHLPAWPIKRQQPDLVLISINYLPKLMWKKRIGKEKSKNNSRNLDVVLALFHITPIEA